MTKDQERDLELLALAEGGDALTPQRRAELKAAIDASPELAEHYEATRLVLSFVDQMAPEAPSVDFAEKLEQRLDAIDARHRAPWWRRWWNGEGTLRRPLIWMPAAAVAATTAAIMLWPSPPAPSASSATIAQAELLDMAENLELLQELEVLDQMDVLDDLEIIESLDDEGESG